MKSRRNSAPDTNSPESLDGMIQQMVEAVESYVQGKTTVEEFELWFLATTWDLSTPMELPER